MAKHSIENDIIPVEQVVKSPRGRKKKIDAELLATLAALQPGQAIRMRSFGQVPQDMRGEVSAHIRKHFVEAHGVKPSINYSPEGYPQVSFRKD